jgi:hypothetical protein
MYSSSSNSLLVLSDHGAGWKVLAMVLKLALFRAKGLPKHLKTPMTKSRIAAASNLLSAEDDHDLQNT